MFLALISYLVAVLAIKEAIKHSYPPPYDSMIPYDIVSYSSSGFIIPINRLISSNSMGV